MRKIFLNFFIYGAMASAITLSACSDDDGNKVDPIDEIEEPSRWVTVAGAAMGEAPGDGNGGTKIFAVSYEDAINLEVSIDVYSNGEPVKSNRTARLQVSEDGKTMFNIAYGGENGGEFSRFAVKGGANYVQEDGTANISQYAGTAPRWGKLYDGDKTGIAVNIANLAPNNAPSDENPDQEDEPFQYYRGMATILAFDLENVEISNYEQYEIPLSEEEELGGHAIFRLDAPVLNQAGDKLIIGTWMRKYDPETGETESDFERLGTKSVVVDYPSLENPKVITSTVAHGDCSGYRSNVNFLAEDGSIYQATQRNPAGEGSYILKITANNEYDNSYVFSLDEALGVQDSYIQTWRYVRNGIGYVIYRHGDSEQSYVARVDLNNRTADVVEEIPNDADLSLHQYQGSLVSGDDLLLAVTPIGKEGNIYILHSQTGEVTKGAKLVNKPGNHYIGVF